MTSKLCPLIEYEISNIFKEISCRKSAPKVSPRSLFNFGKQPKTAIAGKKFFKIYTEWGLSKSIKKLTFFFQTWSL